MDAFTRSWLGLSASRAAMLVVGGAVVGAAMEVRAQTPRHARSSLTRAPLLRSSSCSRVTSATRIVRRRPLPYEGATAPLTAPRGVAVYETVVRKEAERRAAITEPTFADVLKEQWEAKQRELQQSEARRREDERWDATSERKP